MSVAGPAEGSMATTVTPGEWHITRVFEALDEYPVNIGLLGKGSTTNKRALNEQVDAGVIGFKIHEDWGATPAVIDMALTSILPRGDGVRAIAKSVDRALAQVSLHVPFGCALPA